MGFVPDMEMFMNTKNTHIMSKKMTPTQQIVRHAMKVVVKDVVVPKKLVMLKAEKCPLRADCMNRSVKCGNCIDKDEYVWDYTQMI